LTPLASPAKKFDTIEARHIDVAQQDIKILFLQDLPGCLPICSFLDIMALAGHFLLHDHPQVLFVIDY
jgi:hypothetical protein